MVLKVIIAITIGFILSAVSGVIILYFLKKMHAGQTLSVYLEKTHRSKQGTPTMGGLIFILPALFIISCLIFLKKVSCTYSLLIIIFTFIGYFLIGFIDDYLIIKNHNNKGLTKSQKFIMQIVVAVVFFYLFMKSGNEPLLWIHSINFKLNIGWLYGVFILFVLTASSNAVNLTDGLDGLAGGLSVISFITFGIISLSTGWLEGYDDIGLFAFILAGCIMGFLVFNINPAKVFMGDTGSLSLGATMGAYAILTRHEVLFVFIGFVFVLETLSCIIQILYFKLTGKRVFLMAPLHHHFEKLGWKETKIVKMFWLIGLIFALFSLIYGVVL